MLFRSCYAPLFASVLAISACTSAEPKNSAVSTSSSSSSSTTGSGGAGGTSGNGGTGGMDLDDDLLCTALDSASAHETLVASADVTNAPLISAPDVIHDVTIPQNGGFVALQLKTMHTTFVVYASDVETFEVLLDGAPVVESIDQASCDGAGFKRYQHHSHTPSKFVVALPPSPTNQSTVFYHLL